MRIKGKYWFIIMINMVLDEEREAIHMYDDFDEYPYEPSEAESVLEEYKDKMMDLLKASVSNKLAQVSIENVSLKAENKKLKDQEQDIIRRERDIKYKEDNFKREVESNFYKAKLGDIIEQYVEDSVLWFADKKYFSKEKCSLCDDERILHATFPNGKEVISNCGCSAQLHKYEPAITEMRTLKVYKKESGYASERRFYVTKSYYPTKTSYASEEYIEFGVTYFIEKFDVDNLDELKKGMRYNDVFGFKTKEECQKYCDWLNSKIKSEV